MVNAKKCSKCKETKYLTEFYKNRARHDGLCNYCKTCDKKDRRTAQRKKDYRKEYFKKNKERICQYYREYYQNNKQVYYNRNKKWCEENRERIRKLWSKYAKKEETKKRHTFQQAKRRAQKIHATMPYCDEELLKIYQNCPKGYHVDHIIPLLNPNVCGLHVPWNLQYLTAEENFKKNNSFEVNGE